MKVTRAKHKRAHLGGHRWDGVEVLEYKAEGSAPFRDVTRQVLFADPELAAQWRYFEVAPGGHTTLERHRHVHAVMVIRGRGRCLVGEEIHDLHLHDLVSIPPLTWHQFHAAADEPLGFLCLVNSERDRPQLPTEEDLLELRRNPHVAAFIRTGEAGTTG
ncbi:cupin domain-containing protein [Calidithermus chliarophilus]|uniref:cupin domain-containing protein n=1 Tax=Calidithermus chliarophilus TaxID=52023 RepID=UPI000484101B|nr:cupin domain-containing protein [Calidithermus chliarophilus]